MTVKNAGKLEKELDSIRIGSMKLFVNLPKSEEKKITNDTFSKSETKIAKDKSRVVS